jgi:hypothetical protein
MELYKNMFIVFKKSNLILIICTILVLFISAAIMFPKIVSTFTNADEVKSAIEEIFLIKSKALLTGDTELMDSLYGSNAKLSQWAFEHEEKKIKYLHNWSEKQGVKFTDIIPTVVVRRLRGGNDSYSLNLLVSTEYKYIYENNAEEVNSFRIGTYHSMNLKQVEDNYCITKEWYTDPFADSLNLENLKVDSIKEYITSQVTRDFSNLSQRRLTAVDYAYKYSGAATDPKYGNFAYNKKYGDFNPQGGDCANFASQILFEGGKFKKTSAWGFSNGNGDKAWLNAQGFKDYMVGSGRASVIAQGNYEKVYKASYKLKPGDFVAYEKDGKITHISTVTDADTKGYALVNCHNSDRHRVPWDLGWSNKSIKFWLVSVHY